MQLGWLSELDSIGGVMSSGFTPRIGACGRRSGPVLYLEFTETSRQFDRRCSTRTTTIIPWPQLRSTTASF